MSEAALTRLKIYFQHLTPESVAEMGQYYTENAYFRDPFNEVRDLELLKHIFSDMFTRLLEPRFTITETVLDENGVVLIWDFDFRLKTLKPLRKRRIHGLSHIRFAADGRVIGVVGVIGPTRLNYARIVPMVDFTAQALSRLLR